MKVEEAKLFFPFEEDDDLEELWEFRFFEQKQYFLTHAPIYKVWMARIRKLIKRYEAYCSLINVPFQTFDLTNEPVEPLPFPEDFVLAFNLFHEKRNEHKGKLFQAFTPQALIHAALAWLSVEKQHAEYWQYTPAEKNEIAVAQSKELDPMEFLDGLKTVQNTHNIKTIQQLKDNYNNLDEKTQKEVKRLTLLAKG